MANSGGNTGTGDKAGTPSDFKSISKKVLQLDEPFLLMASGVTNVDVNGSPKSYFQLKTMQINSKGGDDTTLFIMNANQMDASNKQEKLKPTEFIVKKTDHDHKLDVSDASDAVMYNERYKLSSDGKNFVDVIFVLNRSHNTTAGNNANGPSSEYVYYTDLFEIKIVGKEQATVICIGDASTPDQFNCGVNSNVGETKDVQTFTLFEPLSATCDTVSSYENEDDKNMVCSENADNGKSKNKRTPRTEENGKKEILTMLEGGIETVKEKVVSIIPKTVKFQWLSDIVKGMKPIQFLFIALFIVSCLFFIFAKMFMILLFFVTFSIGAFLFYDKFKDYKFESKKKK